MQALELAKIQEVTKQKDLESKIAEFNAHVESSKLDAVRVAAEERKKLLNEEAKIHQQKAQYEDQLARRRYQDQLEQQKHANEENLRRTEESVAKQEQMKQQTFQRELQMRDQERKNRIKEEAEVKAKVSLDISRKTNLIHNFMM